MVNKVQVLLFNEFRSDNRVLKECVSLKNAGYQVEMFAYQAEGLPEYDESNGFLVRRVKTGPVDFLFLQLFFYYLKGIWLLRKEKVFHCNDLYTLPIAVAIKIIFNRKVRIVYDAHELETESNIIGIMPWLKLPAVLAERFLIWFVDEVITVSLPIADWYKNKYQLERVAVVLNAPVHENYVKGRAVREEFNIPDEDIVVIYAGLLRTGRGVDDLIAAAAHMRNDRVHLVIIGWGPDMAMAQAASRQYANVHFRVTVPFEEYLNYLASADMGIFMIQPQSLSYQYALPNKLFDFLMTKSPVIVSDASLPMAELVEEYQVGAVIPHGDTAGLARLLDGLTREQIEAWSARIPEVNQKYNWAAQEEVLLNVYKRVFAE